MSPIHARLLVAFLFIVNVTLGATYLIDGWLGRPFQPFSKFINLDGEANLPAWYSSMQLFLLGCVTWVLINRKREDHPLSNSLRILYLLPFIYFLFSLDESAEIHEKLGGLSDALLPESDRAETMFHITGIWMFLLGIPAVALFTVFLVLLYRWFNNGRAVALYAAGVFVFFGSALGLEAAVNWTEPGFGRMMLIAAEEVGEKMGVTLMIAASFILYFTDTPAGAKYR